MRHNFKELNVWRKSMDLVIDIYKMTKKLPVDERFSLVSQINRCAISVPSNIAEGTGRDSDKDFGRFLSISLGSAYELETQLMLVKSLYNEHTEECDLLTTKANEVQKMINGFKRSINSGNKNSI